VSTPDPHGLRLPGGSDQRVVPFTLDGRTLVGIEGEPIAAALHAQGVRVLGRSFKYRRPRGLHCVADACPNCSMQVNGLPGVATCSTALRAGDTVERAKGAPNAEHDLLAAADRLSALTPVGFQYRRFRRSPRLFHQWERVLARLAGTGRAPSAEVAGRVAEAAGFSLERCDVAVIGGGAAGLSAALAAARAGARVMVLERRAQLGGWLRSGGTPEERTTLASLEHAVAAQPLIECRLGSTAAGWYAEGVLAVTSSVGLVELHAGAVVLASGAHERPLAFADNDRPGVMLAGGVQRLLREHAVRPGRRVVVVTGEDYGHVVAAELVRHGVRVAAVADSRRAGGGAAAAVVCELQDHGVELLAGTTVRAASGRSAVRGVVLDGAGRRGRDIACDTIAVANGRRPARELLLQRAATGGLGLVVPTAALTAADPSSPVVEGWWLAGAAGGAASVDEAVRGGVAAGAAAGARG
jgi:sarcosine oxidase subunit alpha